MEKVEFTQGILAMESDLHRFAYKLTSDRDSANDLVQDCVLQALDNHEKFAHAKNLERLDVYNYAQYFRQQLSSYRPRDEYYR